MFGWCFLQSMDLSCQLIPLLTPYLHGVAITCITTFIMGILHIIMADNSVSYHSEDSIVTNTNSGQDEIDKLFSNISVFLMMLHFFWFLFGSVNIVPVIFIEGMYITREHLRIHDCDAPVHFWFTFLCLVLQWLLLLVVTVWYKLESSLGSQDIKQGSRITTKEQLQPDSTQYHSFPSPSF